MRLIDADKLMKQVKEIHRGVDTSEINLGYDTGFHCAISQIQGLIETMPTFRDEEIKSLAFFEGFECGANCLYDLAKSRCKYE